MQNNPELDKRADAANKAYNRFKAAARRQGISEKMMQESEYDFTKWPGVQALFLKWKEMEEQLAQEAANPSQTSLDLVEGGEGGGEGTGRKKRGQS